MDHSMCMCVVCVSNVWRSLYTHFVPDEHSLKGILIRARAARHGLHPGHSAGSNLGELDTS